MAILSCDLQRCCTKVKRCEICVSSTLNQHTSYFHMAVQSCEVQWGCTRVKPSQVCVSDESTKQRSPHCHCWLHSAMVNDLQHLGHLSLPPEAAAFVLHVPSCLVQRSLPICICHSGVARTLKQLFQHHQHHQQHLHGFTAKYFILNLLGGPVSRQEPFRAGRNCFTSSAVHSPCLQQFIYNSKSLEGYCRVDRTHWIHWLWLRWLRPQKA